MNLIKRNADGTVEWEAKPDDLYVATGTDPDGRRIKPIRSHSWNHIAGINLYRGSKWLERDGRRFLIQAVNN